MVEAQIANLPDAVSGETTGNDPVKVVEMVRKTRKSVEQRKEELSNLLTQLDEGVKALLKEENWIRYLEFVSSFRDFSFGNCLLIMSQCPNASLVCGFRQWQDKGRSVRKGERAIRILAPSFRKREVTLDDGTTAEESRLAYFRPVCVFDVSQTDGEDLPESPCVRLDGEGPDGLFDALRAYSEGRGVPVSREAIQSNGCNGYYVPGEDRIVVSSEVSGAQACKTLAHEIGHSLLHSKRTQEGLTRSDAELEAESVAYCVCNAAGLETSGYSFGYLASWKGEKASKALKESAECIRKAANEILDGIES